MARLTYRLLPEQEWTKVTALLVAQGGRRPADDSRIVVAEDGEQIVGVLVVQWVPHTEPLWIDPGYRGTVYWPRLLHLAEQELQGGEFYVFSPDPTIARFAELAGMSPLPWSVFRKEVPCRS